MRVAVFGAGVGGLTVAHQLATAPEPYEVTVYEKLPVPGGQARSEGPPENTREISWRVYFHFYRNLLDVLGDIPSGKPAGSVADHLVPYTNKTLPPLTPGQLLGAAGAVAGATTASDRRLRERDAATWRSYAGDAFDIPQWLGLDKFRASYLSVAKIGVEQHIIAGSLGDKPDFVLDGPTNEVWFEPWVKFLEDRSVAFHFDTALATFRADAGGEVDARLDDGASTRVEADVFVLALPVEALATVVAPALVPAAAELAEKSYQIQLAFQLYLDQNWSLGSRAGRAVQSVLLSETPWALIIEAKYVAWKVPAAPWSVTACQATVPGPVTGKPLVDCTLDEAYAEIVHQITANKPLMELLKRENAAFDGTLRVVRWNTMSDTFFFAVPEGPRTTLATAEPKFSNNAGTKRLRPSYRVANLPNVYISTAYVYETIDIFSMEAAAIAGKLVAAAITGEAPPTLPERPLSVLLGPTRAVDAALATAGMPHVLVVVCAALLAVVIALILQRCATAPTRR